MKSGILIREKCPICESASSKSIFNRSFKEELIKDYMFEGYQGNADIDFLEDVIWEIVRCNKCTFAYQKYILDEFWLNELYNRWIDPKLAEEWNESGKIARENHFSYILNIAKNQLKMEPSSIKILDYGAGFGNLALFSKRLGFETYSYEYSTERIRHLIDMGVKVIDDKNDMKFDFIILEQVLEHLTYPVEILKLVISKLKKNGLLFLAVPNCPDLEKKIRRTEKITDAKELKLAFLDASISAFQHINYFNNYNLKLLIRSVGLKPLSPFKQPIMKPLTVKSLMRPLYRFYMSYFVTSFFLVRSEA